MDWKQKKDIPAGTAIFDKDIPPPAERFDKVRKDSVRLEKDENGNIDGDAQCDKKFAPLLQICPSHTTGHEIVGKGNQQKQNEIGAAQLVVEIEREKSRK